MNHVFSMQEALDFSAYLEPGDDTTGKNNQRAFPLTVSTSTQAVFLRIHTFIGMYLYPCIYITQATPASLCFHAPANL